MLLIKKPPSITADAITNQQFTCIMRNPKSYNRVGKIKKVFI